MGRQSEADPTHVGPSDYHVDRGDMSHPGSYTDDERGREMAALDARNKKIGSSLNRVGDFWGWMSDKAVHC